LGVSFIAKTTAARNTVITTDRTAVASVESTSYIPIFPKIPTIDAASADSKAYTSQR